MSEVHLQPLRQVKGNFDRLFQTTNPSRLGSIAVWLDGSISTDQAVNTGQVVVEVHEPEFKRIYCGGIDTNPNIDPSDYILLDELAQPIIRQAIESIDK